MSVYIKSGVKGGASFGSSLTSQPLTYTDPYINYQNPNVDLSNLDARFNGKLNDVLGPIGSNVFVTGNDLNLLNGLYAYGLTSDDLKKLADINVSASDINSITSLTSSLSTKLDVSAFTSAGEILYGTGNGTYVAVQFEDIFNNFEYNDLGDNTSDLNFDNFKGINVSDPTDPQDIATKAYVDSVIPSSSTAYLSLTGGVMSGNIDMDGNGIIMDNDGNTSIQSLSDNKVSIITPTVTYEFGENAFTVGDRFISNVKDPVLPQDVVTKKYLEDNVVLSTGDVTISDKIILDGDGDTFIESIVDDEVVLSLGGSNIEFGNDVKFDGKELKNIGVPNANSSAINIQYADLAYLKLDGSNTPNADINMDGHSIKNVVNPVDNQDAATKHYVDITTLSVDNNLSDVDSGIAKTNLGLSTIASSGDYNDLVTKPSLLDINDVSGTPLVNQVLSFDGNEYVFKNESVTSVYGRTGDVVASAGDYDSTMITHGSGSVSDSLNAIRGKLSLDGSDTMTGILDMGNNGIRNTSIMTVGNIELAPTHIRSSVSGSFTMLSNAGDSRNPTYAFGGHEDSGMWFDVSNDMLSFSYQGNTKLRIKNDINAMGNVISGVGDAVDSNDAINKGYLDKLSIERVLGKAESVDLMSNTVSSIYDVPSAKSHIITKIIVVSRSYNPSSAPTNPIISVGTGGALFNQIVDQYELDWGGISGSSDQAIIVMPKDGAETPNSLDEVRLLVSTPAAGTFTSLLVDVYVMGIEL